MINPNGTTEQSALILHQAHVDSIPGIAIDAMVDRSTAFTSDPCIDPSQLEHTLIIEHRNGDVSYFGGHTKSYFDGVREFNEYLVDVTDEGKVNGIGEIRFNPDTDRAYFKNKPFVGWTQTTPEFKRLGLGRRRLFSMDLASRALFDNPLYSDTAMTTPAVRTWERLVSEGLAEKFYETKDELARDGGNDRYHFV